MLFSAPDSDQIRYQWDVDVWYSPFYAPFVQWNSQANCQTAVHLHATLSEIKRGRQTVISQVLQRLQRWKLTNCSALSGLLDAWWFSSALSHIRLKVFCVVIDKINNNFQIKMIAVPVILIKCTNVNTTLKSASKKHANGMICIVYCYSMSADTCVEIPWISNLRYQNDKTKTYTDCCQDPSIIATSIAL